MGEEFEKKKKMIEEELREIEEQYKATQERSNGSQIIQTELSPAESYEELTERLLKVAESIQDSARQLGKDDIDLSPRIERIQTLKDECKLSTPVPDTNSAGVQQTDTSVSEKANKMPKEDQRNGQDLANQEERFSSINAVPKIKFRDQFESNCKRKALESSQFQPDKINSKFKNIFEQQGQDQEITVRAQPKKRLITLDQVLIKSPSQDNTNEKEAELEIIKNLRKNWVPPEEIKIEVAQTKLEPGKLKIDHVYGNDKKGGTEELKVQRENELNDIRHSASFAARWKPNEEERAEENIGLRPRSAMKLMQSDDFWVKDKSDTNTDAEKRKIVHEIETIKQARLKFEDEPELRQENEGRLKTLQELEMLRSNQKQADNSVSKIKRDLEEINRSVVMKENSTVHIVDFQTPTDQWKQGREKIRDTFDAKSQEERKEETVNSWKPASIVAGKDKSFSELGVFMKTSNEEAKNLENKTDAKIEEAKNMHFESKAKEKLEEIRQIDLEAKARAKLNEIKNLEIFKLKEKTVELAKKLESERGRKRDRKKTEKSVGPSLRSKSISTLRTAGQKIKVLTNEKLKSVKKQKDTDLDHDLEDDK